MENSENDIVPSNDSKSVQAASVEVKNEGTVITPQKMEAKRPESNYSKLMSEYN